MFPVNQSNLSARFYRLWRRLISVCAPLAILRLGVLLILAAVFWLKIPQYFFTTSGLPGLPEAWALTCNSQGTGNWGTAGTWSCGRVPTNADNVTIVSGHIVTMNGNAGAALSLTISGTAKWAAARTTNVGTGGITLNSGGDVSGTSNGVLTTTGNVTWNADIGSSTVTLTTKTTAGITIAGTGSVAKLAINSTTTNNGTITVSSTLSGSSTLTNGATGVLKIIGTSAVTGLTATTAGNTVQYLGGAQTVKASTSNTYHHLELGGSGVKTLTSITTINGNLDTSGTSSSTIVANFTVGGNLTVGAGTKLGVGANYTLGVTGATSVSGTLSNSNTGVKTYTGKITINADGVFTNINNSNMTLKGGFENNSSGSVSFGTGTITFDTSAQSVGGQNDVTIANMTVTGITVTNNCSSTPYLKVTTALAGTGTLAQGENANLQIGVSGAVGISGLTANTAGNIVDYNGTNQTVKAVTYYNLLLSTSGTKTLTSLATIDNNLETSGTAAATTANNLTVGGTLTVGTGTTFTTGANFTLQVSGATSVTGTLANSNAGAKTYIGKVTINPDGSFTNAGNSNITFRNGLENNSSGTVTFGTGTMTFNTNAQAIGGQYDVVIANLTITGVIVTNNCSSTPVLTVSTALAGVGGTLTQGANATLNIGDAVTVANLDATASGNVVDYTGTSQTVKAVAYENLRLSGSGTPVLTGLTTVNNEFRLTGSVAPSNGETLTVGSLTLTGTTLTNNATLTASGSIDGVGGTLTQGASGILNIGSTITVATLNASASGNIVNYTASGQTVKAVTYHHLTLSGSGTPTLTSVTTINGNFTISGTVEATNSETLAVGGSIILNGSGELLNNATINLTGSVTGIGTYNQGSSSVLNVGGSVTVGTFDASINSNTVDYNGAGPTIKAVTYHHLKISGSGTPTTAGLTTINGNLTVSGTATPANGETLTVAGTLTVTGTTFTNNSTINADGAVAGTGTLTQGDDALLNLSSTITVNTLNASASGNTVDYKGTNQTLKGSTTYYNLLLSTSGTKTMTDVTTINNNLTTAGLVLATTAANMTIGGALTVGTGTVFTTGANYTLQVSGATSVTGILANANTGAKTYIGKVTINAGGRITNVDDSDITFRNGLENNSSSASSFGAGTITFDTNAQAIGGQYDVTITNLTITGVTVTNNCSSTPVLIVSTALAGVGGTLAQGVNATLNIGGAVTIANLTATASGNTVVYNSGARAQTLKATTYNHLTIDSSGQVVSLGGDITVNGNLRIAAGTLDADDTNDYDINLKGNWDNDGVFVPREGIVTFSGTAQQTIDGDTIGDDANFYTLTLTNTTGTNDPGCGTSFTPGVIFAVAATSTNYNILTAGVKVRYASGFYYAFTNINWVGTEVANIFFRNSNLSDGVWYLKVTGTQTAVTYIDVARSNATPGDPIEASDGTNTDCNDNVDWQFNPGTLSVDIVDGAGAAVASPAFALDPTFFKFSYQTAYGIFGSSTPSVQKIRVTNTTMAPSWTLTLDAVDGAGGLWEDGLLTYDYNDPTASAGDGVDDDTKGGQMTIDPSVATITPQDGCNTTGLVLGAAPIAFSEGAQDVITLLTAGGTAGVNCYWDITDIDLFQTIPAEQTNGSYNINLQLTVTAS